MSKTRPKFQAESIIKTWPMVRLGDVCEDTIQRIKSISEPRIAYIDIASIDNVQKRVIGVKEHDVDDAPGRAQQVVIPGDVLVSNVRPNLNAVAIVDAASAVPLIASTGFCVLRVKDMVLPKYVYYYAQTSDFIDPLVAVSEKASYPSVTDAIVKDSLIPLPSLSEQKEIVARLERELAAVEKMKKGFEALAETARAEFKAELKEVFEDSIYALEPLSKYCSFTGGSQPPKSSFIYEPKDGYVRLYQIRDYNGDPKPTYIKASDAKKTSRRGDIMIGRYGASIGLVFWAEDGAYNVAMVKVLINSSAILPEFVFEALHTPRIQSVFRSASRNAQAGFNESEWNKMKLPVPPLSAQREVVSRLDSAKARAEKLEAKAREGVAACETMRKAILKEAFESE